jgi:ParB-like chromosome segregation protein Spo0J
MAEYVSVPATDLFPLLEGEEFEALVADIKANGLLEEIVVDRQKRIIDGRNRWRACQLLSMAPPERVFEGSDAEIVAYSISKNLHRRHLNASQRAMIAAELANLHVGRPEKASNDAISDAQAHRRWGCIGLVQVASRRPAAAAAPPGPRSRRRPGTA